MAFRCCLICGWTQENDILNDGNRNQLNYALLYFKLLTLGNILSVSYISVCQHYVSVKVTLSWGPTKQTFGFGASRIKQESPNPNTCSQALALLPAMHGQSGWIRWHLSEVECIQGKHSLCFKKCHIMNPLLVIPASTELVLKDFAQNRKYLSWNPFRWL